MKQQNVCKRLFILGAGFSKAAGMPLATELTDTLIDAAVYSDDEETQDWLNDFKSRLRWLRRDSQAPINVEEFFHYAAFDIERWKMSQQRSPVGRGDGPATPYRTAEMIEFTLDTMTRSLAKIIWDKENEAAFDPIRQFARHLRAGDGVVTFNYDTLIERALDDVNTPWHHGLSDMSDDPYRVVVLKMHGSIDWVLLERGTGNQQALTLLFSKADENVKPGDDPPSNEPEYAAELWRINDRKAVGGEISRRNGLSRYVSFPGMAGLGSHKPLHLLPGSALVWAGAYGELLEAEEIYIIGFSLSPFDAMSRMLIAEVMMRRHEDDASPKLVRLVDPNADKLVENYLRVFSSPITVDRRRCEDVAWEELL